MKKKILIISQFFYPNNFRINDVVKSLSDKKYEIDIISSNINYSNILKKNENKYKKIFFPRKKFRIHLLPTLNRNKSNFINLSLEYLSFIFLGIFYSNKILPKNKKIDKIFVYGTSPILQALVAIYFKKRNNSSIILWVQDLWPESLFYTGFVKSKFILKIIKFIVRYIYINSKIILIQSQSFKKYIKQIYKHKRIYYLPNPSEITENKRKNFNINKKYFNLLYTGNFGVAQNLQILLFAANELKKNTKIRFYFFGNNKKAKNLIYLKNEMNLVNCFFPGYVEKKYYFHLLSQASILTFGLKNNKIWSATVPSKLQSYLQAGKPIVCFAPGEASKIIQNSKSGYVVKSDDYKGLAKLILKLSNKSKKSLDILGKNGKKYCKKNFDIKIISNAIQKYL